MPPELIRRKLLGIAIIKAPGTAVPGAFVLRIAMQGSRSALLPDLPTVAEAGPPGFDAVLSCGLLAPAGTAHPIIERLNKELRAALATEDARRRLLQEGAEPAPGTPDEQAAVIDREETKWSTLIKSVAPE